MDLRAPSGSPALKRPWVSWIELAFETSVFAFLPSLIFFRGMNARVIELGVGCWLVLRIVKPARDWDAPSLGPLGLFAASFLLSSAVSFRPETSFREFLALLPAMVYCMALRDAPDDEGFRNRLGLVLFCTLGFLGVDVITQALSGTGIISGQTLMEIGKDADPRIRGPFSSPNLLVAFPVFLPSIWLAARFFQEWKGRWWLLGVGSVGVLVASGMLLSESRNVWLAGGTLLLLAGWFHFRWKGIVLGIAILAGLLVLLPQGRYLWNRSKEDWPIRPTSRIWIWRFSLELWKENPSLGIGPKMYPRILSDEWNRYETTAARVGFARTEGTQHHPHNIFLEALLERGVLGLTSFLLLVGLALRRTWRVRSEDSSDPFTRSLFLSLVLLLATGVFDFSFAFRFYGYSCLFLCGLAFSARKPQPLTARR